MHQLWNYVKSTIISHFHTNCKFSPNLMMHTKRKCKCSKIVDPTAIKIIQMCLCDWLFVELELIKLTQEKKTQMATALLNALDLTRCLSRLPFFILANIYFFCFLFSWCMHWLISRWMSRAMWRLLCSSSSSSLLISWGHQHHCSHHQMRSLKSTFKHRHHFHCHSHQ